MHTKKLSQKCNWRWLTWPPVFTFGVVFVIYLLNSYFHLDPDFGWHLKSGEYFLAHGIPAGDIFTYTASNFSWVDHEWLSDIFVSIIYSGGGYILLSVVYAALWTLSMWLVGRKAHNLVIILAVFATVPFAGVRAITWSVLGLALLYTIIKAKNRKFRLFIPLLLLIWANIHGSFVIGLAYAFYMAIKQRSWRLAILTGVGALATLINPYGISVYTEVVRTIGDSSLHFRISEWAPLSIPWMSIPFVLLWLVGFVVTGLKNWQKYLEIDLIFFLAGVSSMRNLVLFVIVSIELTDERVKNIAKMIPKNLDRPRRRFVVITGFILVFSVITIVALYCLETPTNKENGYPKNAVAYLQQHPCSGELFNHYDFGGYLIWKLPNQKVYIDGRMPSWEFGGRKYMDEYLAILSDSNVREKQFATYNVQCVLIRNSSNYKEFINDLTNQHWDIKAKDIGAELLIRS